MEEKEQRRFSRIVFHTTVEIVKRSFAITGELRDLSLKGAFVICREKIPVGQSVNLVLHIGEPEQALKLLINGKVARTTSEGMAIDFQSMDIDTFSILKEIIAYNLGTEERTREEILRYLQSKSSRQ